MKIITIQSADKTVNFVASAIEAFGTEQVWHDKYNLVIALRSYRHIITYATEEAVILAEAELLKALQDTPAGN